VITQCAILAGGLATRLRPLTEKVPKSMIRIKDKPFLAYQIDLLRKNNVSEIVLCAGYLGEQIEECFGDGRKFGVHITYSYEREQLLGTAGALRNAIGLLGDGFFVLYGDSYLDVDYERIGRCFLTAGLPLLLTVFKNHNNWDKSNIVFKNGVVQLYDKKHQIPQMEYIDYGLAVLSQNVLADVPQGKPADLADIYKKLAAENKAAGFEVHNRFYEIGSTAGLREFEELISKGSRNYDYYKNTV
jgi:NDP-sugar pyrophosphorylase family protein